MKKKIIVLTVVAFLLGGTVTFAASNYYVDLLAGQQEQMTDEIDSKYEKGSREISEQVHHDMVQYVESEKNRVLEEAETYLQKKLAQEKQDRLNKHSEAIRAEADRILAELKVMIDNIE